MKHIFALGIIIVLLVVGLCGCNEINNPLSSEENKFVGNWQSGSYSLVYFSDGTGSYMDFSMIWKLKDRKFVIEIGNIPLVDDVSISDVYDYSFSDNDKTLTITSIETGIPEVYIKQ